MQMTCVVAAVVVTLAAGMGYGQTAPAATTQWAVPLDEASIPAEPDTSGFGLHLRRTMSLLRAGESGESRPVRIHFYGQSIAAQGALQGAIINELRRRYPRARIVHTNACIGGYTANSLERTMVHDVVPYRPDLVIFDDYDDDRSPSYEQITQYIRSHTTAEMLVWSPHVDNYGPSVDAGRERIRNRRRAAADRYGCEFVDLRPVWQEFLRRHDLPREALLRDKIHNSQPGCELMARIILRHFVDAGAPDPANESVRTIELSGDPAAWARQGVKVSGDFRPAGEGRGIELAGPNSRLELTFTGNRVDVIGPADAPPASATVLIDDRPPSAWPFNWAVSRPSAGPGTWFPAVNRVSLGSVAAQTEDWTLHFFDLSKDGKQYKFRLSGSITGPDGEGDASMAEFTSTSGRIRFLISDVSLPTIARVFKKDLPPEFDVKWKTYPLAGDAYQRASGDGKSNGDWQTIANDLPSAEHRLIIQPRGDGPIRIRGLEIHRPPFPATPDNLPPG